MRFLLTLAIAIPLCAIGQVQLLRANFNALPGWQQGHQQKALSAFQQSCQQEIKLAKYRNPNQDIRATQAYLNACQEALNLGDASNAQARDFYQAHFQPYLVTNNGNPKGLFTGYFIPTIHGTLTPTAYNRVPIYGKPRNLVRVRIDGKMQYRLKTYRGYAPVPTRQQISQGKLLPYTPVLAWIHSKIDRMFLQIQGSGIIRLPDGKYLLLGYAAQNGHPYYPIGRYLVQKGDLSLHNVSMQTIIAWLKAHPNRAETVMDKDPSFVFFRRMKSDEPIGAEGVPLTPRHSMAIDPHDLPYGMPLWLSTHYPDLSSTPYAYLSQTPFQHLMIDQDTGGAIRGVVRGDVFWGPGHKATDVSGRMQSTGQYWVLIPNGLNANHYI